MNGCGEGLKGGMQGERSVCVVKDSLMTIGVESIFSSGRVCVCVFVCR